MHVEHRRKGDNEQKERGKPNEPKRNGKKNKKKRNGKTKRRREKGIKTKLQIQVSNPPCLSEQLSMERAGRHVECAGVT
jgi:hypothetical protein